MECILQDLEDGVLIILNETQNECLDIERLVHIADNTLQAAVYVDGNVSEGCVELIHDLQDMRDELIHITRMAAVRHQGDINF